MSAFEIEFADLVERFGEGSGGDEDFHVISKTEVGCRYADLCMRLLDDGWHYGAVPFARPTLSECYANNRADRLRWAGKEVAE